MEIISVGSSSSGNSYIIRTGGSVLILDAGLSCRQIVNSLTGVGCEAEDVAAILITHEHADHVKSVRALARKCSNAAVYVSRGTAECAECFDHVPDERVRYISAGESASIGHMPADSSEDYGGLPEDACSDIDDKSLSDNSDFYNNITIKAFSLSHDAAEPIGFSITSNEGKLSVVTDTGVVTDEIYEEINDADMLVIEANHDEELLMYGEYPYHVKMRIKSDVGHLSNASAGKLLTDILNDRCRKGNFNEAEGPLPVMLAHLSFHNNAPFLARQTIEDILSKGGFARGTHYTLTIAAKDDNTILEI